jgi:hypothetical protein
MRINLIHPRFSLFCAKSNVLCLHGILVVFLKLDLVPTFSECLQLNQGVRASIGAIADRKECGFSILILILTIRTFQVTH